MKKYTKILSVMSLLFIVMMSGCGKKERVITDMQQRKVNLPQNIDKAVCLSPGIAELFYKFGIEDKLVGRSYFCHMPEEIEMLPEVGGIFRLDTNTINELHPDVVVASDILPWDARRFLARNNIPLVIFKDNKKIDGFYSAVELFAKVFGKEAEKDAVIADIKAQFAKYTDNNTSQASKPTVYFVVNCGKDNDMTVNKNNLIGNLLETAGYDNIAADDADMVFNADDLMRLDPQYIFVMEKNYDRFLISNPYSKLSAVKNHKVFAVNENWLHPLSVSNIKALELFYNAKK